MARVPTLAMKCKIVNLPVLAKNPRGTTLCRLKIPTFPKSMESLAVLSGQMNGGVLEKAASST